MRRYAYDPDDMRVVRTVNGQTVYTIRGAGGQILTEYQSACAGALAWSRDLLYAGGRLLGAAKSTTAVPVIEVTATTATVSEAATSATVGVRLTSGGPLPCAVTAAWETRPGTATPGVDYQTAAGTVTFAAGTANGTAQTVTVTLVPDALDEDDETFVVALGNPVGAMVGAASAQTLTITDDDLMPTLTLGNVTIAEPESGSVNAVLPATLSAASGRTVTADYATANGTAMAGSDYTAATGTLTFAPGTTTQTISVPILGDAAIELDETFTVALSTVQNATPPGGPATVTIPANDQLTVTLTPNRSFPMAAGTSVTFTAAVTGGTPPFEYRFRITQHSTSVVRIVQGYATLNTFTWTPATADSYTVEVWVRTVGSTAQYEGTASVGPFTVTAAPAIAITSVTADKTFPVAVGELVTWTATATGGVAPLQYQFRIQSQATGLWTTIREYGPGNTATWVVPTQVTYAIEVRVRSAGGGGETMATTPNLSTSAGPPKVPLLTADRPFPVAVGTTVTWTAQAGGNGTLEYAWWLYRPSTGWYQHQGYGASPVLAWTPTVADTWRVSVRARVVGTTTFASKDILNVVVANGAIGSVGLSASQSLPMSAGMPVTWTGTATGGTAPLLYQFWLYDTTVGTWTMVRDWSADRAWTWTPAFGMYAVQVWIKQTGSPNSYDAYAANGGFTVTP